MKNKTTWINQRDIGTVRFLSRIRESTPRNLGNRHFNLGFIEIMPEGDEGEKSMTSSEFRGWALDIG